METKTKTTLGIIGALGLIIGSAFYQRKHPELRAKNPDPKQTAVHKPPLGVAPAPKKETKKTKKSSKPKKTKGRNKRKNKRTRRK